MTQPVVGERVEVVLSGESIGRVNHKEPSTAEVADITALRTAAAAQRVDQDTRQQRTTVARQRVASTLGAGQGSKVATYQDLADLLGIDPA